MFIKRSVSKQYGKKYISLVLTKSYRENGLVKHKSLVNLSSWKKTDIELLRTVCNGNLLGSLHQIQTTAGKSIGALDIFKTLAEETGITEAVGKVKLQYILLLIIGRILTQGSRLKLLDWSKTQEAEEVLGINPEKLTTDDLYETLDYLADNQEEIEQRLFQKRCAKTGETPRIYLYDVTSSYLEGEQNELAAYGYNRDRKQGKMQIVIGLLTDERGYPIAVRVFTGNTPDPKTVHTQITKLALSFGVKEVIFVGDKGMVKTSQIEELDALGFHYITSITKPQIQTLMRKGILQLSLFEEHLGEIRDTDNNIRYVYRRNPVRAQEMEKTREEKMERLKRIVAKENIYLATHPKAKLERAQKNLADIAEKYGSFISISCQKRVFSIHIDQTMLEEEQSLDGCYVIKTDCLDHDLTAQIIHDRYKDLKYVEAAFKTIKTGFLEVRPIYVRKEKRTRGHVFVSMLAYLLMHEFKKRTKDIEGTLEHKVDVLDKVQTVFLHFGEQRIKRIPEQTAFVTRLCSALSYTFPAKL